MPDLLTNKVAIITGSARGLGRAVAEAYISEGAKVIISDVDAGLAEATANEIGAAGSRACDVREPGQVEALVQSTVDEHGGLDIMVPNAGVATMAPIVQMSYEQWRETTSVNLDGVFLSIRYAAPAMIASGGGVIVNICSITALAGCPLIANYAAAKAGVLSLTQTAAVELRSHGVRVNAILPGFIGTDMVNDRKKVFEEMLGLPDFDALIVQKQGRYGEPAEVGRLAVFLASDRSRFATGCGYVLDGGARASLL
ncbi:MAG TPA: SDR family NAD(P)-dependent oxidoreductase [Solirubrobacteraceae bacterium]|jgi:NAD(P)-dependent dehydrogenase (short-subunit alcohol dehydrogenase family)|nr:SDR family NAD(P)-dependent oxidoreductase [Solirubrobacteraceae bacterium]